ncbi:MAG: hypothetical protein ACOH2I_11600 [Pseudomonas sp.]
MNPLPILRDAWYFFIYNLGAIARLCLPLIVLEGLVQQWIAAWATPATALIYELLVGVLFYSLYTAALIVFLDARSHGQHPRSRDVLARALWLWPTFALVVSLSTLAIMLGASLLILPGLWMMTKLAFAEYLLVLRGMTPIKALHESLERTSGYFWPILGCLLCVLLPLWVLEWSTQPAAGAAPDALFRLLMDSLSGFVHLFATVVVFRLFMLVDARPAEPAD